MLRRNSGLALQCFLASLLIWVMCSSKSHAELVYAFNTTGTNQSFTVNAGGTVDIPIYLIQTGTEDRLNTIGMFAMGVTMSYAQQSGPAGIATPGSGSFPSPPWDLNTSAIVVDLVGQTVVMEGLVSNPAFPALATNNAILLGTMTFDAGTVGNVTSLSLSLAGNSAFANLFVDINETFPDEVDLIFRTASIQTIVAVPEPSSLLLVGTLGVMLGFSRRKTRR